MWVATVSTGSSSSSSSPWGGNGEYMMLLLLLLLLLLLHSDPHAVQRPHAEHGARRVCEL